MWKPVKRLQRRIWAECKRLCGRQWHLFLFSWHHERDLNTYVKLYKTQFKDEWLQRQLDHHNECKNYHLQSLFDLGWQGWKNNRYEGEYGNVARKSVG